MLRLWWGVQGAKPPGGFQGGALTFSSDCLAGACGVALGAI
jgi:hypothetical protein